MPLLGFLALSAVILYSAYRVVGSLLTKVFKLSELENTPAHSMRDGLDYEPARASRLFPQHFSAIAAAGPIVGPILAGIYFGWGPAWIWILVGSILVGGIHDFTALLASVRHGSKSIAEVVRLYMNPRAYILFLLFIWFALVYVIIAFTDVTAGTFVASASAAGADAPGPAVATSSILYLLLAVTMGFCLRFTKLGAGKAKLIFIPLVFAAILVGPYLPINLNSFWTPEGATPEQLAAAKDTAQRAWGYILLGYCFVAAMAPVWSLLQPRGELGGYFLYVVIAAAVLGVAVGAFTGGAVIHQPFFMTWQSEAATKSFGYGATLFPILFITVACGACSGFHSIVASGTTSKQLHSEADTTPVAYGGMLMEGFFACISLATYMVLTEIPKPASPNAIYAAGIRDFAAQALAPIYTSDALRTGLYQFALLCFATFVFDTLDACTRLSRYVLMELLGWKSPRQAAFATLTCLVLPIIVLSLPRMTFEGKSQPLWQVFWNIFGSSNQLLAALTLMGVTVWLARRRLHYWITLGPAVFMMAMTIWSLVISIPPYLKLIRGDAKVEVFKHLQFGITISLLILSAWLIVEAIITWRTMIKPPQDAPRGEKVTA